MRPVLYLLLFFCIFGFRATAQNLTFQPKIEYFSFPNSEFNSEEITDIQVDKDGYVWVISFNSIYRFNGKQYSKIETRKVSHGLFLRFKEDVNDRKYVTDLYGNIFFIEKGELIAFESNEILDSLNIGNNICNYYFDRDSTLHFSFVQSNYYTLKDGHLTNKSSYYIDNLNGFGAKFLNDSVVVIHKHLQIKRNLPLGTNLSFCLLDSLNNVIDSIGYVASTRLSLPTTQLYLKNKSIMQSLGNEYIVVFNEEKIEKKLKFPFNIIRLFEDSDGFIWISSFKKGIYRMDVNNNYAYEKVFDFEGELAFVSIEDYQNGLWAFSEKEGLGYVSNFDFNYIQAHKSNNASHRIKDSILTYSYRDLIFKLNVNTKSVESKTTSTFIKNSKSHLYDFENEAIWLASRGSLSFIHNGKENRINLDTLNKYFRGIKVNVDQQVEGKDFEVIGHVPHQYFIANSEEIIYTSRLFNGAISRVIINDLGKWVSTSKGVYLNDTVQNIFQDKKNLEAKEMLKWVDKMVFSYASKGVFLTNNNHLEELQFNKNSLMDCDLVVENDTSLWAISRDGCFNIIKSNNSLQISKYRRLPTFNFKYLASNEEYLLANSSKGEIAKISFEEIRKYEPNMPLLRINELVTETQIFTDHFPDQIDLEYNARNFMISFESLDYQNLNCIYRYKLEGLDSNWKSTNSTTLNFASLAPGDYKFKVQSRFGIGEWSAPKELVLNIGSPFWRTWWFITSSILLLIFVIYYLLKIRFDRIAKEEKEKNHTLQLEQRALRSQMSPHFIFNIVTSLQYLILKGTKEKSIQFLKLFSNSLRNLLDQSNVNFISPTDEIRFITEYVELEKFRAADSFDYKINSFPKEIEGEIPTFVIQPFVENAIMHGLSSLPENGLLTITLTKKENFIEVIVLDNGIGRIASNPKGKKKQSHGIRLVKERLELHNKLKNSVSIEDLKDKSENAKGTKVTIRIRLNIIKN